MLSRTPPTRITPAVKSETCSLESLHDRRTGAGQAPAANDPHHSRATAVRRDGGKTLPPNSFFKWRKDSTPRVTRHRPRWFPHNTAPTMIEWGGRARGAGLRKKDRPRTRESSSKGKLANRASRQRDVKTAEGKWHGRPARRAMGPATISRSSSPRESPPKNPKSSDPKLFDPLLRIVDSHAGPPTRL